MFPRKESRRIVPRWRTSDSVASSKEFSPLKLGPVIRGPTKEILDAQLTEFEQTPTMGIAAETIAAAVLAGERERAAGAARFVLDHPEDAPAPLLRSAEVSLGLASPLGASALDNENSAIHRAKMLVRRNPRNPAVWVDLARMQVSKGGPNALKQARRSMLTALNLAPNNRWVLRSANRFFLHNDEPEFAHRLLANHQRTRIDPWLMAAEIATAQMLGITPTSQRQAQQLIRAKSLAPAHRSELYAAFATFEMEHGANKFARRLFATALENTTENAVAQAEWASREMDDGIEVLPAIESVQGTYEARCAVEFAVGNLDGAYEAAKEWWCDEPFALNPVSMVCYLAGLREDFKTMLRFTSEAVARDPSETLHRHNHIFASIATGEIFRYEELVQREIYGFTLTRIRREDRDLPHALANAGMYLYRTGDLEGGRLAYEKSSMVAKRMGNPLMVTNVELYHAREAILRGAPWAAAAMEEAWRAYRVSRRLSGLSIDRYLSKLDLAARDRAMADVIRRQEGSVQQSLPLFQRLNDSATGLVDNSLPQLHLPPLLPR